MIKAILIDIDDTLLDFGKSADKAIEICFAKHALPFSEHTTETFHRINDGLWKQIERKELTKTEMYGLRWPSVINELGLTLEGVDLETEFRSTLSGIAIPVDGAYGLLDYLSAKYPLYAASNSSYAHQFKRMTESRMLKYFKKMFVSENVGALKPAKEFFEYCLKEIGDVAPNEVAIIGDSLTSDIKGGRDYGLTTIWFSPDNNPPGDIVPDYTVHKLEEIKNIL